MFLSEHVYCVAVTFKMTKQVEQQVCIRFCVKFEHSSREIAPGNYLDDSEGRSCGLLVIDIFITTTRLLMHHILHRDFW